jgi:cell division septal protein FtsQ
MKIKTGRIRETPNRRVIPPPDKGGTARKKAGRKLGNNRVSGRRFLSVLKILGRAGAFLLILTFIGSVFMYAYTSEKFNLRQVTFYGCEELNPRELEEIIRLDFPANILRIDLEKLKERLEKETWARRVEIRRVLPSDLIIYVEERIPSVILEVRGELMVADQDGTILAPYDPRFGKLDVPIFKGVSGEDVESYKLYQEQNATRIQQGLMMLSQIEKGMPHATQKISEVDISDPENLKIILVGDTAEIYLGEKDYLKRFGTLMNEYEKLKKQYAEFVSIDMRFENQIVYLPKHENKE